MVVEPSKKTKEKVWQTLKHEVQHDADKHSMEPLARYKSEYRAYSGQGGPPFNDLSNETPITKSKGGSSEYQWTEKQWAIFEHMYDAADSYEYLNENWDADTEGFRQAVVAYKDPDTEGINRDNSIRVDDFYNYLIKIPEDTSELTKEVDDLIKASFGDGENTNKLERSDAQYIINESPELLAKIGTHLKGQALEAILERLRSVT